MNNFGYEQDWLPVFHLVACGKKKVQRKAPTRAKDLYCSQWFKGVRKVIEQRGEPWAIVSASYLLLSPDSMVFAYDVTLKDWDADRIDAWAKDVCRRLPRADRYVLWMGNDYAEALIPHLPMQAERPMEGLGIGQQLAYLAKLGATPSTLEACEAAADLLRRMDPNNGDVTATDWDWDCVMAMLNKAIAAAKAKGDGHAQENIAGDSERTQQPSSDS